MDVTMETSFKDLLSKRLIESRPHLPRNLEDWLEQIDIDHASHVLGSQLTRSMRDEQSCKTILEMPQEWIPSLLLLLRYGLQEAKGETCPTERPPYTAGIFDALGMHEIDTIEQSAGTYNPKVEALCLQRTNGECMISGSSEKVDAAHILPLSCTSLSTEDARNSVFWLCVQVLLGRKVAQVARILSGPKDTTRNVIPLSKQLHELWDAGAFQLTPESEPRHGRKELQFVRRAPELNWDEITTTLDMERQEPGHEMNFHVDTPRPLKTDSVFHLDKNEGSVPEYILLEVRLNMYHLLRKAGLLTRFDRNASPSTHFFTTKGSTLIVNDIDDRVEIGRRLSALKAATAVDNQEKLSTKRKAEDSLEESSGKRIKGKKSFEDDREPSLNGEDDYEPSLKECSNEGSEAESCTVWGSREPTESELGSDSDSEDEKKWYYDSPDTKRNWQTLVDRTNQLPATEDRTYTEDSDDYIDNIWSSEVDSEEEGEEEGEDGDEAEGNEKNNEDIEDEYEETETQRLARAKIDDALYTLSTYISETRRPPYQISPTSEA